MSRTAERVYIARLSRNVWCTEQERTNTLASLAQIFHFIKPSSVFPNHPGAAGGGDTVGDAVGAARGTPGAASYALLICSCNALSFSLRLTRLLWTQHQTHEPMSARLIMGTPIIKNQITPSISPRLVLLRPFPWYHPDGIGFPGTHVGTHMLDVKAGSDSGRSSVSDSFHETCHG
jgi:hypothetical protein